MQTLNLSTGFFDTVNTFVIVVKSLRRPNRYLTASLHRDYQMEGDGVLWAMQRNACIKSCYSDAGRAEAERLSTMLPIGSGDIVMIEGKQYKVKVNGDYSDCAIFEPI